MAKPIKRPEEFAVVPGCRECEQQLALARRLDRTLERLGLGHLAGLGCTRCAWHVHYGREPHILGTR